MKIAVMSDIHGFSLALRSVLADIAAEPDIDRIVIAGDLCEAGPDPAGALAIIDEHGIPSVQGNTDRDIATYARDSEMAQWTIEQIGPGGMATLAGLPFDIRITPPGGQSPDDDLLVVHATPFDQDRQIPPTASDREVREILDGTRAAVIAFGHVHVAYQRWIGNIQLFDVSSVGNPKDEDLRSKWGLCVWDEAIRTWSTELRYVDYPLEATLKQMEASGMPKWEKAAKKLQRASYREL